MNPMATKRTRTGSSEDLLEAARSVRTQAYAPYSDFKVGAAVLAASGRVYVGCNVENASFAATICAERAAVVSAVAAGELQLRAIAVVAAGGATVPPCGVCLQTLSELGRSELRVILSSPDGRRRKVTTLGKLMPLRFGRSHFVR
jgi:cytidine deaminase